MLNAKGMMYVSFSVANRMNPKALPHKSKEVKAALDPVNRSAVLYKKNSDIPAKKALMACIQHSNPQKCRPIHSCVRAPNGL